jgi:hypothetical protein
MADTKVSALTELTRGNIAADDKFRDDNNWLYPPQYREYEVE